MAEYPQDTGILVKVEDDGHPFYWLYTFWRKPQKFYCSYATPPIDSVLRIEYVINDEEYPVIRKLWNLGEPI